MKKVLVIKITHEHWSHRLVQIGNPWGNEAAKKFDVIIFYLFVYNDAISVRKKSGGKETIVLAMSLHPNLWGYC